MVASVTGPGKSLSDPIMIVLCIFSAVHCYSQTSEGQTMVMSDPLGIRVSAIT